MRRNRRATLLALAAALACGETSGPPGASYALTISAGDAQTDTIGQTLPLDYAVKVADAAGAAQAGVTVSWTVTAGGGSVSAPSVTDANGIATATRTLGTVAGTTTVKAQAGASSITFTTLALPGPPAKTLKSAGDAQAGAAGITLPVPLAVLVQDQFNNPVESVTVHWAVTAGAGALSDTSSKTSGSGVARTTLTLGIAAGTNTVSATVAGIAVGQTFNATGVIGPVLVKSLAVTENYGLHDELVRDGLAFLFAWNSGVLIYDVGNGIMGGSPPDPKLVGSTITSASSIAGGPAVHNGWWFHNPNTNEKKYLFVGQEGPAFGGITSGSSGLIHVVDVSDLTNPHEVAFYHKAGTDSTGTHNFWMDETNEILYAAYYNGGVVALDVSGTLSGDLSNRLIDSIRPGGIGNTYVWGVQLYNGSLYASDMASGLWQLSTNLGTLASTGGGNNEAERYTSDLWLANGYAYTGTWDHFQRTGKGGSLLKIWQLNGGGAPVALDSILVANVGAVSDLEVSPDGRLLMFSTETGANSGFWFYSLTDPGHPRFLAKYLVASGVHTATFGTIGGRLYAFGAKNPNGAALVILDVTSLDQ